MFPKRRALAHSPHIGDSKFRAMPGHRPPPPRLDADTTGHCTRQRAALLMERTSPGRLDGADLTAAVPFPF